MFQPKILLWCFVTLFAIACGGGGGGGSGGSSAVVSENTIDIAGVVTDEVIPNAIVQAIHANGGVEEVVATTTANANGEYVISLPAGLVEQPGVVLLKARGVDQHSHVVLTNLVGSLPVTLGKEKNRVYRSRSFNITHVSTAQWFLVKEDMSGFYPEDQKDLEDSLTRVADRVLNLAARIKLVVDNPTFEPEGEDDLETLLVEYRIEAHLVTRGGDTLSVAIEAMSSATLADPEMDWERDFAFVDQPEAEGFEDDDLEGLEEDDIEGQEGDDFRDEDEDFEGEEGDDFRDEDEDFEGDESDDFRDEDEDEQEGDNEGREEEDDDLDNEDTEREDNEDEDEPDTDIADGDDYREPIPVGLPDPNGVSPLAVINSIGFQAGTAIDPFTVGQEKLRFLSRATFGARGKDMSNNGSSSNDVSSWMVEQFSTAPSYHLEETLQGRIDQDQDYGPAFWKHAVDGPDQLRQRVAFALSQIMVVSDKNSDLFVDFPSSMAGFYDILVHHSFGNFRNLIEDVTYSPTMGHYLTYIGNQKADPSTGRQPDENYAREILQLFTIGLVELHPDGTAKTDSEGKEIETYTNADITGLAKVFTGLWHPVVPGRVEDDSEGDEEDWEPIFTLPMSIVESEHSPLEKSFLGSTISAGTPARESISQALDIIFQHPNVGPFIGRQLIQRLVRSNPSPAYVGRVSSAFDEGRYVLPDKTIVGSGERGDLAATVAAVLLDPETLVNDNTTGKVREPILRFAHWARAFDVSPVEPELVDSLRDASEPTGLGQHPLRSSSVFNFYRPGFVLPGSLSGAAGLVAPELQIVNATTLPGVSNFLYGFVFDFHNDPEALADLQEEFQEIGLPIPATGFEAFKPDYSAEVALAANDTALMDHLDLKLCHGTLSPETREAIIEAIAPIGADDPEDALWKVMRAVHLTMNSPDYIVQP